MAILYKKNRVLDRIMRNRRAQTLPAIRAAKPVTAAPAAPAYSLPSEIPKKYNDTYVRAMPRDPQYTFVYWERQKSDTVIINPRQYFDYGDNSWHWGEDVNHHNNNNNNNNNEHHHTNTDSHNVNRQNDFHNTDIGSMYIKTQSPTLDKHVCQVCQDDGNPESTIVNNITNNINNINNINNNNDSNPEHNITKNQSITPHLNSATLYRRNGTDK